jgi:hypothetical protein
MASRRVNPNRVKIHRTYTARELADLLGVHKNTVRHWLRTGLTPVDNHRPHLFHGAVVRRFLTERNKQRKRPCPVGTLYCFRCREPRKPVATAVEYVRSTIITGNLRGPCCECGTIMHRRVRQDQIQCVLPGLLVQMTQAPSRLSGRPERPLNCDLERQPLA